MGTTFPGLVADWFGREPVAGLFLVVTAVLIFARSVSHHPESNSSLLLWTRKLIHALAGGLLFLAMAGAFQFLLTRQYAEFDDLFASFTRRGSLPYREWSGWRSRYGGPLTQKDLVVAPTIQREIVESITPIDPLGRTLYRNTVIEELLTENLITSFEGNLHMIMVQPGHPTDGFNAFTLTADYRYQVENPAQEEVLAKFSFPIPDARLCRDIRVTLSGEEIPFFVKDEWLTWETRLEPGQHTWVSIHYFVSGMDYFVFEIPDSRQIRDFTLRLMTNAEVSGLITEPEGAVSMEVNGEGAGKVVTWKITNAIAAPRMGTYMTQGWRYAPSHTLLVVLPYAARALMFFLALAALTFLIAGEPIDLRRLALLGALFCVPALILMSGLPVPGGVPPANWGLWQARMLPLLALLAAGPGYLILRDTPPLPRALILTLMVIFSGIYPLAGSIPDEQQRNAILGGAQAGMILYIFAYTLFTRIRLALRA